MRKHASPHATSRVATHHATFYVYMSCPRFTGRGWSKIENTSKENNLMISENRKIEMLCTFFLSLLLLLLFLEEPVDLQFRRVSIHTSDSRASATKLCAVVDSHAPGTCTHKLRQTHGQNVFQHAWVTAFVCVWKETKEKEGDQEEKFHGFLVEIVCFFLLKLASYTPRQGYQEHTIRSLSQSQCLHHQPLTPGIEQQTKYCCLQAATVCVSPEDELSSSPQKVNRYTTTKLALRSRNYLCSPSRVFMVSLKETCTKSHRKATRKNVHNTEQPQGK